MKRPSRETVTAVVAVVVLALVTIFTQRPTPETVDSYASDDYASGGYRAYATLLEREGVRTGPWVRRPIELDDTIDTLVSAQPLPFSPRALGRSEAETADLAAWVRRGGRLVFIGRASFSAGAALGRLRLPAIVDTGAVRDADDIVHPEIGPFAADVHALQGLGSHRIVQVPRADLDVLLADARGPIVVRYALGRGTVTVMSDPTPFVNGRLGLADNARLAFDLALPHKPNGFVAFDEALHGTLQDRPWYLALTPGQRFGAALLGLAIVLGLGGAALRGGAAVRLEPEREPTSAEFIAALAALRRRTGAREITREALELSLAPRDRAALDRPVQSNEALLAYARAAYARRKERQHGRFRDERRTAFAGRARAGRRR